MEKKNLDWGNLGFGYMTTDYRYVANYKEESGNLMEDWLTDPTVTIEMSVQVYQYSQSCFEGLKMHTQQRTDILYVSART